MFSGREISDEQKDQLNNLYAYIASTINEEILSECFDICVRPGNSVTKSEAICINNCTENFMKAHSIISKATFEIADKKQAAMERYMQERQKQR